MISNHFTLQALKEIVSNLEKGKLLTKKFEINQESVRADTGKWCLDTVFGSQTTITLVVAPDHFDNEKGKKK